MKNNSSPTALVTGSTSGIGKSIALYLIKQGYSVIFHSRSSVEAGESLSRTYTNCHYCQADLNNHNDVMNLCQFVKDRYKSLNTLINCAAISQRIPHHDLLSASPEVWNQHFQVNVIAPWILVSHLQPLLQGAQNSSIINISSHAGSRPKGASIPYAVSKAALNHVTKLLAKTLAPQIRVNAIAPGLTDTPLTHDWNEAFDLWHKNAPMRRPATIEEIAQFVFSLIDNTYITGEVIFLDGGMNLT